MNERTSIRWWTRKGQKFHAASDLPNKSNWPRSGICWNAGILQTMRVVSLFGKWSPKLLIIVCFIMHYRSKHAYTQVFTLSSGVIMLPSKSSDNNFSKLFFIQCIGHSRVKRIFMDVSTLNHKTIHNGRSIFSQYSRVSAFLNFRGLFSGSIKL